MIRHQVLYIIVLLFASVASAAIPLNLSQLEIPKEQPSLAPEVQLRLKLFEAKSELQAKIKYEDYGLDEKIHLVRNSKGLYSVIVHVPMQKYLMGVLPAEMPAGWPIEALKAQAVASRSYALAMKNKRKNKSFDLEVTVADQVFNKRRFQRLAPRFKDRIRKAVTETQGEVLKLTRRQVMTTYFHAHCGGRTKTSKEVWGIRGQSKVVVDESCAMDVGADWSYSLSEDVLRDAFFDNQESKGSIALVADNGKQVRIQFGERVKIVAGDLFRRLIGYTKVKATEFQSYVSGDKIHIKGKGYGHGVGMCQSGARFMAKAGNNYKQILHRYYGKLPISLSGRVALR